MNADERNANALEISAASRIFEYVFDDASPRSPVGAERGPAERPEFARARSSLSGTGASHKKEMRWRVSVVTRCQEKQRRMHRSTSGDFDDLRKMLAVK